MNKYIASEQAYKNGYDLGLRVQQNNYDEQFLKGFYKALNQSNDIIPNQYLLVDGEYRAMIYNAANVKLAICDYAKDVGLEIRHTLFERAISTLNIEEVVELFNNNCLSDSDKINKIFTGFTTLYRNEEE